MGTLPPPSPSPSPHRRSIFPGLCAALLLMTTTTCRVAGAATPAALVGTTECSDCAQKSIRNEDAFKGLRVAIKCRVSDENYHTKAAGELDRQGSFVVALPGELLMDDGKLKHECFAQLHSTANAPCSEPSKIILKSKENGKHTFIVVAASGKLSFSSATCVSATFWPPHQNGPWRKFPKFPLPPFKFPFKPFFHPHPIYSPPSSGGSYRKPPSSGGYYKPPAPVYKPPSSGGYYKPPAPVQKPPSGGYYKPPAPVYKPPSSGGYYKPPAPVQKPPSGGYYRPAAPYHKHPHHLPVVFKKPWPPIPHLPHPKFYFPPIYEHKPLPEFPGWPPYSQWHKYFHRPGKPGYPPASVHHQKP